MTEKVFGKPDQELARLVLSSLIAHGMQECCLACGSRNAPLIYPLVQTSQVKSYHWPEERSAAFFALGRIKATKKPVAVVTTSGTAAGELLAAAMEAHYSGLPLILITADRPKRFRGSGAPQSAEQSHLFAPYVCASYDLEAGDVFSLPLEEFKGPVHFNVCFEEPKEALCREIVLPFIEPQKKASNTLQKDFFSTNNRYLAFLEKSRYPFVIVGALPKEQRDAAVSFLCHLGAPVYAEAPSHLREDARLDFLKITDVADIWKKAKENNYPIDGVLRLGSVPTARLWRDLEYLEGEVEVCNISALPFSGLSFVQAGALDLEAFFDGAVQLVQQKIYNFSKWKAADQASYEKRLKSFEEHKSQESGLIHTLSSRLPKGSHVYLGNSLPIREWDLAATYEHRDFRIECNRGVNGIDGQLSTFLGASMPYQDNFALLGDLTMLYDLAAPWVTQQIDSLSLNVIVINNKGSGLFLKMYEHPIFFNRHNLSFEPLAAFWGWQYEEWREIPEKIETSYRPKLIELVPEAVS